MLIGHCYSLQGNYQYFPELFTVSVVSIWHADWEELLMIFYWSMEDCVIGCQIRGCFNKLNILICFLTLLKKTSFACQLISRTNWLHLLFTSHTFPPSPNGLVLGYWLMVYSYFYDCTIYIHTIITAKLLMITVADKTNMKC